MNAIPSVIEECMDGDSVEPLFKLIDARTTSFTGDPPKRKFLTEGTASIPLGVTGVLAGPGGSSKSMMAIGVSLALASGKSYLGFNPTAKFKVLYLSGEDDREEIWRRIHAMLPNILPDDKNLSSFDGKAATKMLENFYAPDLCGQSIRLSENVRGIEKTEAFDQLAGAIKQFEKLDFIVLDTGSRFRGGSENDAADTAFFISICEQIVSMTGATVLLITHTNKGGGGNQNSVRGSSALVDNARFVMTMEPEMNGKDPTSEIKFRVAKNNYGPTVGSATFQRLDNGTLKLLEDTEARVMKHTQSLGNQSQPIIDKVRDLAQLGKAKSIRDFSRDLGGVDKEFGLAQEKVSNGLKGLVEMGRLILVPSDSGRSQVLNTTVQKVEVQK